MCGDVGVGWVDKVKWGVLEKYNTNLNSGNRILLSLQAFGLILLESHGRFLNLLILFLSTKMAKWLRAAQSVC